MKLPSEDWYIRNLYRFYFMTGLLYLIITVLILLDLAGVHELEYDTLYGMAVFSFVYFVIYLGIPVLFFLPFIIKLIRFGRKNFWLGLPLWIWIFQFLLLILSYSKIFAAISFLFFSLYGLLGLSAGLYGIRQIRKYESLELKK